MLQSLLDWLGIGRAARPDTLDRFIAGGESIAQISADAGADILREQRRIETALRGYILKLEAERTDLEEQIADLEEQITELEGASGP